MGELAVAFTSGLIFALGLVIGDMTNPARVLGFLDVAGHWDPTMMFVVAGAVITASLGHRAIMRRARPILAPDFALPLRDAIDRRLIAGSALFGIGWGLGGFCPGPAVAFVPSLNSKAVVFLISMLVGMALHATTSGSTSRPH